MIPGLFLLFFAKYPSQQTTPLFIYTVLNRLNIFFDRCSSWFRCLLWGGGVFKFL